MKLFLTSMNMTGELTKPFLELVGKGPNTIKMALIENAADLYKEEKRDFLVRARADLESLGFQLENIDLKEYKHKPEELYQKLSNFDVIWVGGGNVYYLRWLFKETGFDKIIQKLLENGVVYAGGSAGAIVAGPTLKCFSMVDDTKQVPEYIQEGLGLTDIIIIPHWENPKYQTELLKIKQALGQEFSKIITLTDNQALVVQNNLWKVFPI